MTYYIKILAILVLAYYSTAQTACTNIPPDNVYYLTSFCDQTTACGKSCGNCNWYYAADSQRFKCGTIINCVRGGKSANLEVIDYGPNCDLEKKSGKPIIDASYSACKLFSGSTSCGWSDKLAVTCKKAASPNFLGKLTLGPCTWDLKNTELPYCHLEQTKHAYNFSNIEQWVSKEQLKERISNLME